MRMRTRRLLAAALITLAALAGCSRADGPPAPVQAAAGPAAELRLGYLPNITHAPALIGDATGIFAAELGPTKLITQQFNAGPAAVAALLGGSLDAAFIGSGPAINAFAKSGGRAVRLIAGSTSGGAQLVTAPDITAPEQLRGRIVATPQAGNSQDVALRTWLKDNSLAIGDGPGEVIVANIDNARTLDLYRSGEISGGWLPEPWTSRMVAAGATVLVDEASLWPGGRFPTTVLVVRTEYLQRHPETIEALLRGEQRAIEVTRTDPADAKAVTNEAIRRLTGSALAPAVLDRAFDKLAFSGDPLAATFPQLARHSVTAGALPTMVDLRGFVDLTLLNRVRRAAGQPAAAAAGLDNQGRDR